MGELTSDERIALRELGRAAPTILLSGRAWTAHVQAAEPGVAGLLRKPIPCHCWLEHGRVLHDVDRRPQAAGGRRCAGADDRRLDAAAADRRVSRVDAGVRAGMRRGRGHLIARLAERDIRNAEATVRFVTLKTPAPVSGAPMSSRIRWSGWWATVARRQAAKCAKPCGPAVLRSTSSTRFACARRCLIRLFAFQQHVRGRGLEMEPTFYVRGISARLPAARDRRPICANASAIACRPHGVVIDVASSD
jgi:hypothetical protein